MVIGGISNDVDDVVGEGDVIVVHDNRFLTDSGIVVDGTFVVGTGKEEQSAARNIRQGNTHAHHTNWNELQDSEMMIYEDGDGEADTDVKPVAGEVSGAENADYENSGSKMAVAPQE